MITVLRCERYIDMYLRFQAASNRVKANNAHDYTEVLSKLVMCQLDPTDVLELAMARGFEQQWLEKKKKGTNTQGTKRHIMEMLRPESPARGPQAPLALELGALAPSPAAPLALELGALAP